MEDDLSCSLSSSWLYRLFFGRATSPTTGFCLHNDWFYRRSPRRRWCGCTGESLDDGRHTARPWLRLFRPSFLGGEQAPHLEDYGQAVEYAPALLPPSPRLLAPSGFDHGSSASCVIINVFLGGPAVVMKVDKFSTVTWMIGCTEGTGIQDLLSSFEMSIGETEIERLDPAHGMVDVVSDAGLEAPVRCALGLWGLSSHPLSLSITWRRDNCRS